MTVTEDTLVSYAFGHLASVDEAVVEAHLRAHPDDARTVAAYLDVLASLVMALPPEPLPAGGEEALLARVRGPATPAETRSNAPERTPKGVPGTYIPSRERPRRAVWWRDVLAAAAVAGLYVSVFTLLNPDARTARVLQGYRTEPGAVSYALNAEGRAEPLGTLVRLQDGRVFVALGVPPSADQVYQAWEIAGAPVSLGTFDGRTFLSAQAVTEGNTFGLTLEPPGGSDQPTSTPITLLEL
ncbi:MAG: hypothetical protein AVDCRST_MAG86-3981 [uncultured Truepera sp.]|uniref:Regulator of SigK n=1 Tax=uncultured Truepera sp. TaxID=543023 RepID=A0A6J4VW48_9DEIN|nr:MAG: hypothetical protein AVDCRST_MAG86-3981 [uncultured Truepera sp.]